MTKKPLYIIGAGSVGGHVALNIHEYGQEYTVAGFFDDDPQKIGTSQFGAKVIGRVEEALSLSNAELVVGIAFPRIKEKLVEQLASSNSLQFPSLVHQRAWISQDVSIGEGCIIYPGTTVNFGSIIDDFVVLNANCSLGHNTSVGAFTSFAPGVKTGGYTTFEDRVDVGIGASTIQGIIVGAGSTIGGQSMLVRNVEPGTTVAGVPARELGKGDVLTKTKT